MHEAAYDDGVRHDALLNEVGWYRLIAEDDHDGYPLRAGAPRASP